MLRYCQKICFASFVPLFFVLFTYRSNQGYFAEHYDLLLKTLGGICIINGVLCFKANVPLVASLWLGVLIPIGIPNTSLNGCIRIGCWMAAWIGLTKIPQKLFGAFSLLLIAMEGAQAIYTTVEAQHRATTLLGNKVRSDKALESIGNIYWIVCDGYTSLPVLQQHYRVDGDDFSHQLQSLGFQMVDGETSAVDVQHTTSQTLRALNTYANFQSIPLPMDQAMSAKDTLTLHFTLKDNHLWRALQAHHYTICATRSRFPFLHHMCDVRSIGPSGFSNFLEFVYQVCNSNPLLATPLKTHLNRQLYHHQEQLFQFLENNFDVRAYGDKVFTYIHLDVPHAPFIRNGENHFQDDQACTIWGENNLAAYPQHVYQDKYAEQVRGLNKRLVPVLKSIVSKDPTATIIVQGDHGAADEHIQHLLFAVRGNALPNTLQPDSFFKDLFGAVHN